MFTKLTKSGGHTYVQLVESFRDENGRPRQRTVSTLGRLDEVGGQVDALLKGLLRAKGMPAAMAEPPQLAFESALALVMFGHSINFGKNWALTPWRAYFAKRATPPRLSTPFVSWSSTACAMPTPNWACCVGSKR